MAIEESIPSPNPEIHRQPPLRERTWWITEARVIGRFWRDPRCKNSPTYTGSYRDSGEFFFATWQDVAADDRSSWKLEWRARCRNDESKRARGRLANANGMEQSEGGDITIGTWYYATIV